MIAFASDEPRDAAPFLAQVARLSRSGNLVDGWERRAGGNHPDGWGIAWRQGDRMNLVRSGKPAGEDPLLGEVAIRTDRFIGHVRYASNPATVNAGNSHPFAVDGVVLAHNGTFRGRVGEEGEKRGVSDTLVFTEILAASWKEPTHAGLLETLRRLLGDGELVGEYSAANLLISSGGGLYALRNFRKRPDYYTLFLRAVPGLAVAASEPLDDLPGWRPLENGELVDLGGPVPRSLPLPPATRESR